MLIDIDGKLYDLSTIGIALRYAAHDTDGDERAALWAIADVLDAITSRGAEPSVEIGEAAA